MHFLATVAQDCSVQRLPSTEDFALKRLQTQCPPFAVANQSAISDHPDCLLAFDSTKPSSELSLNYVADVCQLPDQSSNWDYPKGRWAKSPPHQQDSKIRRCHMKATVAYHNDLSRRDLNP